MRVAWIILAISVITDFVVAFGTALTAGMVEGGTATVSRGTVLTAALGGLVVAARTIQQELKASGVKLSDLLRKQVEGLIDNREGGAQ